MNKIVNYINKYKFYIVVAIVVIVALEILNAIGKNESEEVAYNDDYTTVTAIPGVKFDVEKKFSDSAQAVLEISKKVSFLDYQTYSYKNGSDIYLLFNIKKMIVIGKKNTDFNLENGIESLQTKSLNGIWFKPLGSVTKNGDKAYVDVSAEVIITNDVFNDFTGRLCTIKNKGEEYSLFIGSPDPKVIEHIADSFETTSANNNETKDFVVDLQTEEVTEIIPERVIEVIYESADVSENSPSKEEVKGDVVKEVNEPQNVIDQANFEIKSNQKSIEKEEGKAYSSSIYSMLNVGDMGFIKQVTKTKTEKIYVVATAVLNNEETMKAIDKHISSGNSYYESFEVPKGSHLEALRYDYKASNDTYLNSYLEGLDGSKLKQNGLTYSQRTYDILNDTNEDGWVKDNIVFYLVPNGCSEYVIQFGDKSDDEKCYYHIKN